MEESNIERTIRGFLNVLLQKPIVRQKTVHKIKPFVQKTWLFTTSYPRTMLGVLRRVVISDPYTILSVKHTAENFAVVTIKFTSGSYTCTVIREHKPYKPSTIGTWGVNPVSFKFIV